MKSSSPSKPVPPSYIPQRGDIVWIDFDPQVGREQSKRRTAIVLSPQKYNRLAQLVVVCPTSTKVKGYPFEVPLSSSMKTVGVVLSDQIKSFDWKLRNAVFVEKASPEILIDVLAKIETFLF